MKSTICTIIEQYGINRIHYSIFVFGSEAKIKLDLVNIQNKDTLNSHVDKHFWNTTLGRGSTKSEIRFPTVL